VVVVVVAELHRLQESLMRNWPLRMILQCQQLPGVDVDVAVELARLASLALPKQIANAWTRRNWNVSRPLRG